MKNSTALLRLRGKPEQMTALIKDYNTIRRQINQSVSDMLWTKDGSPPTPAAKAYAKEWAEAKIKQAQGQMLAAIESELQEIAALEGEVNRDIQSRFTRLKAWDNAAVVRESKETRAWARTKAILDTLDPAAVPNEVKRIATAAMQDRENGPDTIAALRAELGAYVTSRGGDHGISMTYLDQAQAAGDERAAEGLAARSETQTGLYQLRLAASQLAHAVEQGESGTIIPLWERGATVPVTFEPFEV